MNPPAPVRVGCAGWSIPRGARLLFLEAGSNLERYAARLNAVEINSSLYRPHREATYARWAASVPEDFRFAVKVPRTITHLQRLREGEALLDAFLRGPAALGEKLGCLLVQLPPGLEFEPPVAAGFLRAMRERHRVAVVVEARHPTWFADEPSALLRELGIGRVAADPPRDERDGAPGGSPDIAYYRLHGSPRVYFSAYAGDFLERLAEKLLAHRESGAATWCIFDNTALGAAAENALFLRGLLAANADPHVPPRLDTAGP